MATCHPRERGDRAQDAEQWQGLARIVARGRGVHNGYSKRLKKAYTAKLKKLPDFSTLGYIYSDWAKDGFDGKQLTVTTYI